MEVAHGAVPCAGDHGEEGEAGEEMDVLHFFEVFVIGKEKQGGKTGEKKTDGSLGEDGKGGGYVAEVVVPSVFGIAQVEEGDRHAHEEEERRVSDDGFREEPAFNRGTQDDGREPADLFAVDMAGKPVSEEDGGTAEKGGGQAGCHFIETKERVGKRQLPVVKDRFVVPVVPVDLWRDPVTREHHFLGGESVVRLSGVGDGKELVADEIEKEGNEKKREVGVLAKCGIHRASFKIGNIYGYSLLARLYKNGWNA